MTRSKSKNIPYSIFMLILLSMIWGGTFPATRMAVVDTDPLHFLSMRFWLAIVIFTPFFIVSQRRKSNFALSFKTDFRAGAFIGIFLMTGYILQVIGLRYTTASRSGFLTSLLVIITPVFAWMFRTSKTPILSLFGIPISIVGIYIMSDPRIGGLNQGDWLTIGSATAFAAQMIALEHVTKQVKDVGVLAFGQMLTAGSGALIWSIIEGNEFYLSSAGIWCVLFTALFGTIGAVWLQTRYQPDVTAGLAALIFTLEPVFASIFAFWLLGEVWTQRGLIGAGIILIAMMWSSYAEILTRRNQRVSPNPM